MSFFQLPENSGSLFVRDVEDSLGIGQGGQSYLISNGRLVSRSDPLVPGCVYHVVPRVLGGKGGFGSMLRAIGAQIEKTTSQEACRDLSGRRIRDVNNEKQMKDWVAKQGEREREKEEREDRRRAKRAKYLQDTPATMNNPEYDAQYSQLMKTTEEAIHEGLARLRNGEPSSRKRKADSSTSGTLDKYDRWNMMGGLNPDDLDSDSGSESGENISISGAHPGPLSALPEDTPPSSSSSSRDGQDFPRSSSSTMPPSATVTSSSADTPPGDNSAEGTSPCKRARLETPLTSSGEEASGGCCSAAGKREEKSSGPCAALSEKVEKSPCNSASANSESTTEPIDLDQFSGPEDLQTLGMDRLKADLMRRGLKCGGSLAERSQHLFSIQGLAPEDIPAKLLARGKGQGKSSHR